MVYGNDLPVDKVSSEWFRGQSFKILSSSERYNSRRAMQITIDVPPPLDGQSTTDLVARARLLLVVDEVRAGRLTRAAGAAALGMSLDDFLIEAGAHGLLAIDYDVEDFRRELATIAPDRR